MSPAWGWPESAEELVALQQKLARAADAALAGERWTLPADPVVAGTFIAYARGEAGPGHPGDRAWAAAASWRTEGVLGHAVVRGRVPAAYAPGLLAWREGPLLAEVVAALRPRPDVVLVDATGRDHPRGAGLAVQLGAVTGLPTVGVTHRPLVGTGALPPLVRGATAPVRTGDRTVGFWVCTRSGTRPVVAHAGWRTDAETAAQLVLAASTPAARTPIPLQQARRWARETRALEEGRRPGN